MSSLNVQSLCRRTAVLALWGVFVGGVDASVLVVDITGGPGSDYTSVFDALSASSPGDTIVVRSGDYPEPLLVSKGLTVVADVDAVVSMHSLTVSHVGVDQAVRVRGIRFDGVPTGPSSLFVDANDGAVWIEACEFESVVAQGSAPGGAIRDSGSVVLVRCEFFDPTFSVTYSPLATLRIDASSVRLFDTDVTGKSGAASGLGFSQVGYPAISVNEGSVAIEGGRLLGGNGGNWQLFFGCASIGPGGAALELSGGSTAVLAGVELVPGAGGSSLGHTCVDGAPGVEVIAGSSDLVKMIDAPARSLSVNAPAEVGGNLNIEFGDTDAGAGDLYWLMVSLSQSSAPATPALKPFSTLLALGSPQLVFLGTPPLAEPIAFAVVVPDLGSGISSFNALLQGVWFDASTGILLPTAPSAAVLVAHLTD